jgi:glutamyl-tRNA synthetase
MTAQQNAPRTRFAPSPTGFLHIGGVRTALYSYLFARHHGGQFILRIEDTDRERSTPEAVRAILDGMAWLHLDADEGPFYQSERFERYREAGRQLLAADAAYHCYCTREELEAMRAAAQAQGLKPRYDGRCRDGRHERAGVQPVLRFKNPQVGHVVLEDRVKGRITFDNAELDDLIILRSDGSPTYNFTVVVDDADMRITHVIRGDDHVNNTPRQINLFSALGLSPPVYAHLPMIHGADGAKLSKRHGAVSVLEYRENGFLPDALLNYLLRLGWSHGDMEVFSRDEMIRLFDLDHVSRSAANFDQTKLAWVNQQHIMTTAPEQLAPLLVEQLMSRGRLVESGPPPEATVNALRERSQTMADMAERALCFYGEIDEYDAPSAAAHLTAIALEPLRQIRDALSQLREWTEEATQQVVEEVAVRLGLKLGKVAQPLRVALTGQAASPPIGTTLVLIGRLRALERIERALDYIGASVGRPT